MLLEVQLLIVAVSLVPFTLRDKKKYEIDTLGSWAWLDLFKVGVAAFDRLLVLKILSS